MDDLDHTRILAALAELPFDVGKGTLSEVLTGAVTKKMVANTTYMDLNSYGSLEGHPRAEVDAWIDRLVAAGHIAVQSPPGKPYWKLLSITAKGKKELRDPTFITTQVRPTYKADNIDAESATLIEQFAFFLGDYNDEQRHAIVCPEKRILCVAGAGSGKTTVLTKRAEFLTRFRGVPTEQVLAITFTRKARQEMQQRLEGLPITIVTFNGFCERLLRQNERALPIISYGDKMRLFHDALREKDIEPRWLVHEYFTDGQRQQATGDELLRRLMRDVFGVLDHYANEDQEIPESGDGELATILLGLARDIHGRMESRGVRDYSGQLRDALRLLREDASARPHYTHILVDEYQDINAAQHELLKVLDPENLFVVGDPRQSIFGWRGSRVGYIMDFPADATIQLRTNYRSGQAIIRWMNAVIARMRLPELRGALAADGAVQVLAYGSEDEEANAVAQLCKHATTDDLFVLARTNSQLETVSGLLSRMGVPHNLRQEDDEGGARGITLSTVHAIKGLEAKAVIVIGVSNKYFPIRVSDHPVMDLIKDLALDKEEEELRLLYVAISRAKESLIITHSGSRSYFLDPAIAPPQKTLVRDDSLFNKLRAWRASIASDKGLPAYCILTDKTLRELADRRPENAVLLGQVNGIGPAKVEQYGEDLLALLR